MTAFRAAPLPPVPHNAVQTQAQANSQAGSSAPEDNLKTIEKLVEHMSLLNVERLKKLVETKWNQSNEKTDVEMLGESIRVQSEQNQVLRRVFGELEKELRSLTETRIELEIKLDYLNTASTSGLITPQAQINSSSTGSTVKKGVQAKTSIPATPVTTAATTSQTVVVNTPQIPNSSSNNSSSGQQTSSGLNGAAQMTPSINSSNTSKIII